MKKHSRCLMKWANHSNLEVINGIESNDPISVYSQGEFTDLCRGPHVNNTNMIKSFKLLHTSSAYWRGDERNQSTAANLWNCLEYG